MNAYLAGLCAGESWYLTEAEEIVAARSAALQREATPVKTTVIGPTGKVYTSLPVSLSDKLSVQKPVPPIPPSSEPRWTLTKNFAAIGVMGGIIYWLLFSK